MIKKEMVITCVSLIIVIRTPDRKTETISAPPMIMQLTNLFPGSLVMTRLNTVYST